VIEIELSQIVPFEGLDPWPAFAMALVLALGGALLVHAVVYGSLHRIRRTAPERLPLRGHLVLQTERPARWALALVALRLVLPQLPPEAGEATAPHLTTALSIGLVIAVAWLVTRSVKAVRMSLGDRLDLQKADNLSERQILTQVGLLQRLVNVVVIVVAVAAILLHFESVRRIGAGLLASAGVAGIVLGFAAQRVLGNLFAGIQIAITQPIRVDDVVVVEGEWARVEEITLTYVVVRIWDLRRLVLPISYFIETPFQNWTRTGAQVIGTVYVRTDYTVPVEDVRAAVGQIVEASEHFDGETWRLHVTDLGERGVEMRALMTASNADHAWELRCEVREELLAWLREHHPEALPRTRVVFPDAESDPARLGAETKRGGRGEEV
jgi:small-conductance mechanosensitive channel